MKDNWELSMPLIEIEFFDQKNFSNKTLSHEHYLVPSEYAGCSFENANMNSVVFEGAHFKECIFDECDASNSRFTNCIFRNCTFRNASFTQSLFTGCLIIQSEKYEDAFLNTGLGNVTFAKSPERTSRIEGVRFKNNSFRNAIFDETELIDVTFMGVPFEKVTFRGCKIDKLDLTFGTVKGLHFTDTIVGEFETTAEKSFSIIGLYDILAEASFKIFSETEDDEELVYENLSDVCQILSSGVLNLAQAGALYEFLNSVCFLSKALSGRKTASNETLPLSIDKNTYRISGDLQRDVELGLDWFVVHNSQSRTVMTMNSVNYALDVLLALDIVNAKIFRKITEIARVSSAQHRHPQVSAEVFWKLSTLETNEVDTHYTLTVTDHSVGGIDYHSAAQLADCLSVFLEISGISEYRVISRSEGSLVEKIVFEKLGLVSNFKQLVAIVVILNFSVEVDLPKYGVHFSYNAQPQATSTTASIKRTLSVKDVEIVTDTCKKLNFDSHMPPDTIDKILKACMDNSSKLSALSSKDIDMSIMPAQVKELSYEKSSTDFLLPAAVTLEQKVLG